MYYVEHLEHIEQYRYTGKINSLIDCVYIENYFSISRNQWVRNRIFPDNTVELILTDKRFKRFFSTSGESLILRSHLSGLKTKWQDVWLEDSPLISIRFKPDTLFQLINTPAKELCNRSIAPSDLFGRNFIHFEDKLFNLRCIEDKLKLIEVYFTSLLEHSELKQDRIFLYSKKMIEDSAGQIKIKYLIHKVGITNKTLENKFRKYLGITPKEYCRLVRFISCIKKYDANKHSLTSWAYQNYFFDQSHFIKEIQAYSGYTPSIFFSHPKGIQSAIF